MISKTPPLINIEFEQPPLGELVGVYSEQADKYGYARQIERKKYGSTLTQWQYDAGHPVIYSPISHWFLLPVKE